MHSPRASSCALLARLKEAPVLDFEPEELSTSSLHAFALRQNEPLAPANADTEGVATLRRLLEGQLAQRRVHALRKEQTAALFIDPLPPALVRLEELYADMLRGEMLVCLLPHVIDAARQLAAESSEGGATVANSTAVLFEFCSARLLCPHDALLPLLSASDKASAKRQLRLLDVQVQLRLSLMAVEGSATFAPPGASIKAVRKLLQLYALQLQTARETFCQSAAVEAEVEAAAWPDSLEDYLVRVLRPFHTPLDGVMTRLLAHFHLAATPHVEADAPPRRQAEPSGVASGAAAAPVAIASPTLARAPPDKPAKASARAGGAGCVRPLRREPSLQEHRQRAWEHLKALPLVTHSKPRAAAARPKKAPAAPQPSRRVTPPRAVKRKLLQEDGTPQRGGGKRARRDDMTEWACESVLATPVAGGRTVLVQETPSSSVPRATRRGGGFSGGSVLVGESPLCALPRALLRSSPRRFLRGDTDVK
ncbi:hypothetical protein AB1Y20_015438 [Prymnesium parvum]|uniref:Uncharacterized protein n=1 Tax=Prymnesium parvum TaxID=97485 RepID=A0AB34K0W1_PRYPA